MKQAVFKQKSAGALQRSSSALAINRPGDRYEQEADRVAEIVSNGGTLPALALSSAPVLRRDGPPTAISPRDPNADEHRKYPGSSLPDLGFNEPKNDQHVQQPPEKTETNEDRLGKAGEKLAETFLDTPLGKELTDKAEQFGKGFVSTLPSFFASGGMAASTIAAMALRHQELPIQLPVFKLTAIAPGLKVKLTYKGPLNAPTEARIAFAYEPGAGTKADASDSVRYRAETDRIAADQAKFQEGTKTPTERIAEQRRIEAIIRARQAQSGNILGIPGLTPRRNEPVLQRDAHRSDDLAEAPRIVHDVLRSPGQPLDHATRSFMEPRFGHDFSRVRVHTDGRAAESAQGVNANAYTVGNNVVFGAGRFEPGTQEGQRLIAHELTHVVQQSGADTIRVGQKKEGHDLFPSSPFLAIQREPSGPEELAGSAKKWLGRQYSTGKEAFYKGLISGLRKFQKATFDMLRANASRMGFAQSALLTILDVWEEIFGVLITLLLAVVGIVVGFGEGIVAIFEGLVRLVWGIVKWFTYLILGFFDNGQKFEQYNKEIIAAVRNMPDGLRALVRDWYDKIEKAPIDRGSVMIGELTGQIIAFIASFGVAAAKVGQVPKLVGEFTVVVSSSGELAMVSAPAIASTQAAAAVAAVGLTSPVLTQAAAKNPIAKTDSKPQPDPVKVKEPEVPEDLHGLRDSPGGKAVSEPKDVGNFVHHKKMKIFEKLQELIPNKPNVTSGEVPPGAIPEYPVRRRGYTPGREPSIDRLDRAGSTVIEIKPHGLYEQGLAEAKVYAQDMDILEPLPNGQKWQAKCVTYDLEVVKAYMKDIGLLPKP